MMVQGGAGVADTLRICQKDGADAYAWAALYIGALMKTLTLLTLAAALSAAEITVTVKADNGQTLSVTTMTTTNIVLQAVDNWREAQIATPAVAEIKDTEGNVILPAVPAALRYPDVPALWRGVVGGFIRSIVADQLDTIKAEKAKIAAAQAAIEGLKTGAVQ